ncbi:hypothetical protein BC2903_55900 [Bacillus cereus]|nr:hypothetical protein BC2903_55900 [Bacillus cereus]
MTLIAGIILPKGILMISDTRLSDESTGEIDTDYQRKLTSVAPNCIMGTAGSESSFYTAKILRDRLYKNSHVMDTTSLRSYILDFYNDVNQFSLKTHIDRHPIGSTLLADYDVENNSYTLTARKYYVDDTDLFTYTDTGDIELIGANLTIQQNAKTKIQALLSDLTVEEWNHTDLFEYIAKQCQSIFQQAAKESVGISNKLYVIYLSTLQNEPATACFLLEEDGSLHDIDRKQDGEIISYTK